MTASATGEERRRGGGLLAVSRANEWWEYKLVPIFAAFYATGLMLRVPLWTLWPAAFSLVAALAAGAVYVSVINDITDRADDAAGGKTNRMAGRTKAQAALLVAVPVLVGLAFCYLWLGNPLLLAAYLGAWTAFSLYSLPPFRLKKRGFAGVIADASGAHLFPTLVASLLVFAHSGKPLDLPWLAAAALWAAAYGLRGNLWHQLSDLEADRAAGIATFAQRRGQAASANLARYAIFPVEAAALAALLWQMRHPLPVLLLLFYFLLVRRRMVWWEMKAVLITPRPRYLILLQDYYDVFLPLAILAASALTYSADWAVVAIHLLVFPNRLREVARDTWRLRNPSSRRVSGP